MDEDYLCHYGVLGMKWGIRKKRPKSSTSFKRNKKNQNKKKTDSSNNNKKKTNIKKLSDSELQGKIRRLQLEKQYRDLKKDEVSAGKKLLGDILRTSGRTLGVQVANYVGGKAINKLFGDEVVKVGGKKKNKNKSSNDDTKTSNTTTKSNDKKVETNAASKNNAYNNSAYNNWYSSAQKDAYTRVVNDIFENYKKSKNSKSAANAVIIDVQDVKVSNLPALPASTKKRK